MVGINKTERILKKAREELTTPASTNVIGGDLILPNQSGDHSAGIVNTTPVNPTDIANKAYVDEQTTPPVWEQGDDGTQMVTANVLDMQTKNIINADAIESGNAVTSEITKGNVGWNFASAGFSVQIADEDNTIGAKIDNSTRTINILQNFEGLNGSTTIDNYEFHLLTNNECAKFQDGTRTITLADGSYSFTCSGGDGNMGTNKIINVVDPTADQDASTKKYVDDQFVALIPHNLLSATHTDTVVNTPTVGSMIYSTDGTNWDELTAGTNGHVLTMVAGVPTYAAAGAGTMNTVKWTTIQQGGNDIVTLDFSAKFTISEDPDTEINIEIDDSEIDHNSLKNYDANRHFDHSAISITAGTGLTGGGSINANRTINVIGGTGITANANDIAVDQTDLDVEDFTTSLTTGSIPFSDGTNLVEDNSDLFWDNTNKRLGVGTATPSNALEVVAPSFGGVTITATTNDPILQLCSDSSSLNNDWTIRMDVSNSDALNFRYDNAQKMNLTTGGDLLPSSAGSQDLGSSGAYWGVVNYKTLTDRGCLGFFDDGVLMPDGNVYSDLTALTMIKKHPTKLTIYGKPMLDYKSFPVVSYDEGGEGEEGIEMTSMFSIFIGAFKELKTEIDNLKSEIAILKNTNI